MLINIEPSYSKVLQRSYGQFPSNTNTGDGIREAIKQAEPERGARPGVANKIMLVFTDGWNNKGIDPVEEAKVAIAAGFRLLSISVVVGEDLG